MTTGGCFVMDNNAKIINFEQSSEFIKTKEDIINYLKNTNRIDYDALINVFKSNDNIILSRKEVISLLKIINDKSNNRRCPYCNSSLISRHQKYTKYKDGVTKERFRCKDCRKTFSDTTNTIFHNAKLSFEKIQMCVKEVSNDNTIRRAAKNVNISVPTAFYMKHKILGSREAVEM